MATRLDDAARDWFADVRLAPISVDARIGKGAFHMRANAPAAALRRARTPGVQTIETQDAFGIDCVGIGDQGAQICCRQAARSLV